jgi:hypothetical protein
VAESAVVLHWQGTDSSLKPVLVTNSDGMSRVAVQLLGSIVDLTTAVLDVKAPQTQNHAQDLSCGDDNVEHKVEIADVQSGVGMM